MRGLVHNFKLPSVAKIPSQDSPHFKTAGVAKVTLDKWIRHSEEELKAF